MSSTRSIIAPPPFAANALTTIPPTPVAGVSYRDPVAGPASSPNGWPYAQRVNSAEFNQILYQISSLVSIIDAKGVLGWSSAKDYTEASVVFGSDGTLYKWLQASGPANGGAQDPTTAPLFWQTLSSALNQAVLPLNYFAGFTLANNVSAPNTTVDVGAGSARNSLNTLDINLAATLRGILQASGAWAAGDNQNKLDTGAKAINSTYHVFVIRKTSDGTGDILFSLSATAPTVPSGYSGFRRISRIATDASGNIRAFKDRGNGNFDWVTPSVEITASAANPATSPLTITGVGGAPAMLKLQIACGGDGAAVRITPIDVTNAVNTAVPTTWLGGIMINAGGGSAFEAASGEFEVMSDATGQVTLRTTATVGTLDYRVILFGWREVR